jgi:hypothetical protein
MPKQNSRKKKSLVPKKTITRTANSARLSRSARFVNALKKRQQAFLARRPHRSFRRTRRRDYVVSTGLSGYVAFTRQVGRVLRANTTLFFLVVVTFSLISLALAGITSQETYKQAQELLNESKGEIFQGTIGKIGEAGLLLLSGFTGGSSNLSSEQQIYLGLTLLLTWLASIWLLREVLAGRKPRFRDGLYSSGAPIVSTTLIVLVMLIQLIPVGVVSLVYAALAGVGIVSGGFGAMIFAVIAILVVTLVLYWMVPSFIALVIVTLPGMYPFAALRAAGDLVVGRRLAILYRILWLLMLIVIGWLVVMVPLVILDGWLKTLWQWYESVPIVPVLVTTASTATLVWSSAYIYMLYRKLVDYGAER